MPLPNQLPAQPNFRFLVRTAVATGLILGATARIVYADPNVDPAPETQAPADSKPHSNTMSAAISDTAITTKVKYSLASETGLHGSSISVTTANGVVQLSGHVQSGEQKSTAEQLAQEVKGVKAVDSSQIVVASAMNP